MKFKTKRRVKLTIFYFRGQSSTQGLLLGPQLQISNYLIPTDKYLFCRKFIPIQTISKSTLRGLFTGTLTAESIQKLCKLSNCNA